MPKIIIYDFEVFRKNVLLGTIILDSNSETIFQTWDKEEIKKFYYENKDTSIWVGHNNVGYDGFILQAVIQGKDPKKVNDDIIEKHNRFRQLNIKLYQYDLMLVKQSSLKAIEAFEGKNISESEVDFNLDRELTEEEKRLTESYNRDDLNQTLADFRYLHDPFELRLMLLDTFKLPLTDLTSTEAMLAAKILKAHKIPGIESLEVKPKMYSNLIIKNQEVIDFYLGETWRNNKTLTVTLCGTKNKIARGGIHAAEENVYYPSALYIDVSGYYNLIMILLGLLPRSIPEEGKKIYANLYQQQLAMKKTNPKMRQVFKIILLAVSGAMAQEFSDFYDPYHGDLMRLAGQMFLVDLLEKLEGKVKLVQSNTDGIIVVPLPGVAEQEVIDIARAWMDRTGFNAKVEHIYNITQRDVNNYMYQDDKGNIEVRGEAVKHYGGIVTPYTTDGYMSKEALIISQCIVDYFIKGIEPEETVEKFKSNPRMFQFICKKGTFDYLSYEKTNIYTGEVTTEIIQHVNRAFAWSDSSQKGMIYKRKNDGKKNKYPSLPESVFVYNNEVLSDEAVKNLTPNIDYDYYIQRSYERILQFLGEDDE